MLDSDDDEWQTMPVLHSSSEQSKLAVNKQWQEYREDPDRLDQDVEQDAAEGSGDESSGDEDALGRASRRRRLKLAKAKGQPVGRVRTTAASPTVVKGANNTTGNLIDFDDEGAEWREKGSVNDEEQYTRLELDEDADEDDVQLRTQYLFDDDKGMTPLSQMQTTKTMLSEGQRIAYVGLCRLVTREMITAYKGLKELEPATEGLSNWATKIMGRLYQHMEVEPAEQRMIEQLAEHGVTAMDLVPSLATTHTVPNPEYDPDFEREMQEEAEQAEKERLEGEARDQEANRLVKQEGYVDSVGSDAKLEDAGSDLTTPTTPKAIPPPPYTPNSPKLPDTTKAPQSSSNPTSPTVSKESDADDVSLSPSKGPNLINGAANALPGVSTNLTAADKMITLDIRWTILCDLFLSLVADSVYDARSRVLLCRIADQLGLSWTDVIRFERRLTEALELQESVAKRENVDAIEGRKNADKKKRYMMMGLATLGGGLVIGLSAGLLAPVIGAGIGAAFATVGVSGTSAFLGGAGGAAVITSTGTLIGGHIGGKGMARRTKAVTTFDLLPLHNNRRLSVFVTIPGFMNGPQDDVRLPFSVMDPVMGDVFSVLWEPATLGQTGNALKILGSEVLSSVGQQMLQLTLMSAMMSALQWPILLTKLGYLIDNPWSNALDRAKQAGEVFAQILINRSMGVRPVSLIGFSLGARVLFYTLVALAKARAFGIVQDVYLMGATVTASRKTWREVRGVVSGRFVNAYARNDWILGYLFRATVGGLQTVAGLRPVEFVPELENVDITDLLAGHMSYRSLMPVILQHLGFKVSATSFDEPEDLNARPEREIVTPEIELARLEAQKKASWLKRFRKDKSGSSTPTSANLSRKGSAVSVSSDGKSVSEKGEPPETADIAKVGGYDDLGDLPSRLGKTQPAPTVKVTAENEDSEADIASSATQPSSRTSADAQNPSTSKGPASPRTSLQLDHSSKGVGFDIAQIREQIAKDDGSAQLVGSLPRAGPMATPVSAAPRSTASVSGQPRSSADIGSTPARVELHRSDTAPSAPTLAQQQKEQESLERQEEEYEARLAAREAAEEAEFARTRGYSQQSSHTFYEASSTPTLHHPYSAYSNPFASSSTTSFSFPSGSGRRDASASTISFGADDGSISFADAGADPSPWSSSSNASTNPFGKANDPWSNSAWNASSKW